MNNKISEKIKELFAITNELEVLYPGRKFTIDGHTIGSIGEVLAAEIFDLHLYAIGQELHDAYDDKGNQYQIKATQINKISLSSSKAPQNLIVIKFSSDGNWDIVYDGEGAPVWEAAGKPQKNGQKQISLSKIKKIKDDL